MQTTIGQLLVNQALPEHLRDYTRVLDKKGIKRLLRSVADEGDAELYRDVVHKLHKIGYRVAHERGSSFSIRDLQVPPRTRRALDKLNAGIVDIINRDDMTDDQRDTAIKKLTRDSTDKLDAMLLDEALAAGNPFAEQVVSGSRGGPADLRSLMLGDMLVTDAEDRVIPAPISHGYASGVDPAEYWAGSYGARKGTVSTKFATAYGGFLGKQLAQAAHREVVTDENCGTDRGIPVKADDPDNVGTVLVAPVKGKTREYAAGTVVTPRIIDDLDQEANILVRSPLTCEARNGVCARCVGIRERGGFPAVGDNVGLPASQALSEKLSQGALNVKHSGGRARTDVDEEELTGLKLINQLVQVPKAFRGGATVASADGTVQSIDKAPQGGHIIKINGVEHHVPANLDIRVKAGDRVEAGDVLTSGIPNPAELVRHRGVGDGRLQFVQIMRDAFAKSNLSANRRNIELLARGLVNHVEATDVDGMEGSLPGDVMEYTALERTYEPRYGARDTPTKSAAGTYLEKPYAHFSIGTRVNKRVARELDKAGVHKILVHDEPPPFEPRMVRAMDTMSHVPDWQTRMSGWYLRRGMLDALHSGVPSSTQGTSYVPAIARGKGFGEQLKTTGVY